LHTLFVMRMRWWRRVVGRSLLRERSGRRSRAIGSCPRCGDVVVGAGEDWLEAENAMAEHLLACPVRKTAVPEPVEPPRAPHALRLA
jgi:hypothetical protein